MIRKTDSISILNKLFIEAQNVAQFSTFSFFGETRPALYLALYTSEIGINDTTFNEVKGGGYKRIPIHGFDLFQNGYILPQGAKAENEPEGQDYSEIKSAQDIVFPMATADWGTITTFGICSSAEGGSPFLWGDITEIVGDAGGEGNQIVEGEIVKIPAGQFCIRLGDETSLS